MGPASRGGAFGRSVLSDLFRPDISLQRVPLLSVELTLAHTTGFRHGRDMEIFTKLRVISINVEGFQVQKTHVFSTPYSRIACWTISTKVWDHSSLYMVLIGCQLVF